MHFEYLNISVAEKFTEVQFLAVIYIVIAKTQSLGPCKIKLFLEICVRRSPKMRLSTKTFL